ncbi:short-chain type dehydrogenase/reductase-like [Quillaja saponaria]|uniref:Short-chain type dehydrogenase/reductase-like n=1 Tax=Quillaja saponaria TaxID=32244 RepID=A0AAD7Q7T7_QUISA|nr:short-chain type dehydrogenase/reductase-like [Quillaja saponaria]KAJ7976367.1 short-chain type dehydrogenase/reductase-like [Quillaja saponaria]
MASGGSSSNPTIPSSRPLQDRVTIVTGSSGGIGGEIALHLGSLGAKVVVSDISNFAQAESVAAEINSKSSPNSSQPRAIVVPADISDPTQIKYLFDEAEQSFNSPVHILVNTAGVVDSKCPSIANTCLDGI